MGPSEHLNTSTALLESPETNGATESAVEYEDPTALSTEEVSEKSKLGGWLHSVKDKYFPPTQPSTEMVQDVATTEQLGQIEEEVEEITAETLRKVGNQLGSNEGGWYENPSTGERMYIKFYENPDQAKVEFVANAVYAKLGIKAVHSELLQIDGRDAISSAEIPDPQASSRSELHDSDEVKAGFVADAYLANWDVVGLCYDNIVSGEDGMYRVDNGGAIIFRAQGGAKEFPPDDIPELKSMLNPNFPAGKVFDGITESDMAAQAKILVERLSEADIKQIIEDSGLTGDEAATVLSGLIGRRQFLIDRFNLSSTPSEEDTNPQQGARLPGVLKGFEQRSQSVAELGIRAREAILSDSSHLENQEISFVDHSDEGHLDANFKLTEQQSEAVLGQIETIAAIDGVEVRGGTISYKSVEGGNEFPVSDAVEIVYKGITIKVSKGTQNGGWGDKIEVMSAKGLVCIEMPISVDGADTADIENTLNDIMINILGVPEGLAVPTKEAEERYTEQRYRWSHKLPFGPITPEEAEHASRLVRKEVYPEYHTMVEEGRSKEYESQYGEYAVFHTASSADRVVKMLKSGGIMSSHERFRRGLLVEGMSTAKDFTTGGADSVFVRTVVEGSGHEGEKGFGGYTFVMGPELFDRTDFYAYPNDTYGSTRKGKFEHRQSPEEVLEQQVTNGFSCGNEQMFRTGIPSETFKAIACEPLGDGYYTVRPVAVALGMSQEEVMDIWEQDPLAVEALLNEKGITVIEGKPTEDVLKSDPMYAVLKELEAAGIDEVNGVPIKDFVVRAKNVDDFIDIAHGRVPRSKQTAPASSTGSDEEESFL